PGCRVHSRQGRYDLPEAERVPARSAFWRRCSLQFLAVEYSRIADASTASQGPGGNTMVGAATPVPKNGYEGLRWRSLLCVAWIGYVCRGDRAKGDWQ